MRFARRAGIAPVNLGSAANGIYATQCSTDCYRDAITRNSICNVSPIREDDSQSKAILTEKARPEELAFPQVVIATWRILRQKRGLFHETGIDTARWQVREGPFPSRLPPLPASRASGSMRTPPSARPRLAAPRRTPSRKRSRYSKEGPSVPHLRIIGRKSRPTPWLPNDLFASAHDRPAHQPHSALPTAVLTLPTVFLASGLPPRFRQPSL